MNYFQQIQLPASAPIPRKYDTAPARMRKREMPNVWDLQACMALPAVDTTLTWASNFRAATLSSVPSELPNGGDSWSRKSKQRTNQQGSSMNLWEVSAALSAAAAPSVHVLSAAQTQRKELSAAQLQMQMLDALALEAQSGFEAGFALGSDTECGEDQEEEEEVGGCGEAVIDSSELMNMLHASDAVDPFGECFGIGFGDELSSPSPTRNEMSSPSPTSVTALFTEALNVEETLDGGCGMIVAPGNTMTHFDSALQFSVRNADHLLYRGGDAVSAMATSLAAPRGMSSKEGSSRNGSDRKEWTSWEDDIIHSSVVIYGCKWRRIAALLPGRSDDAVRNRWNRLKEATLSSPIHPSGASAPVAKRVVSVDKPERVSWTKAEDATILSSVQELGHKWNRLAERLPGRTDHAIRNRFHRLQTMLGDQHREQGSY